MKKIIVILLVIFCGVLLISCGESEKPVDDPTKTVPTEPSNDYVLRNAGEKVDIKDVKDSAEYQSFIEKLQLFSAKLSVSAFNRNDISTNLCISPVSVYMALAMVITSSSEEVQEEFLNAVGVTLDEVNNFTKYLYSYLKNEKYLTDDETLERKLASVLDLNNSIWITEGLKLKDEGLDNLANNFMTDLFNAPFVTENEKANKLLSQYVEDKTRGLIKSNFQLDENTLFVLVNTLYMKDFWGDEDLNYTDSEFDFVSGNGEIIKQKLLQSNYHLGRVYETTSYSHFQVITNDGYKLKLMVPKDGYNLSDIFTVDNLVEVSGMKDYRSFSEYTDDDGMEYQVNHYTRTLFPKFEASYKEDLIPIFKEDFNISKAFEMDKNMPRLTEEKLHLSQIIHQTKLKVDETGIEGAAVTIMVSTAESVEIVELHEFLIDRAFGYILTDNYGNILFTGVINTI